MTTVPQAVTAGDGHERKDADVASIFLIAMALLLLVLLVFLTVWMTLRHLRLEQTAAEKPPQDLSVKTNSFPEPRLQIDPATDLAKMRARNFRELNNYGWIDRKAGTARIPIERAMQLIAQHGLPDVGQNQTPLSLMQARPASKNTPSPQHRKRY
jgi:hypothetical protein